MGLFPVPYSRGVFHFHWFNFYNAICFQIILGAPVVLLAKDLGANSVILVVIAAFTPLMTVLQLPSAHYLARYSYRSFALMGGSLRSVFIATAALVPLLSICTKEVRLGLLLASLFFFNLLRGISTTSILPWITGIVSDSSRSRFLSIDQIFISAGALVSMLFAAFLMKGHPGPGQYSLVLWVSVVGAVISLNYLRKVPDAHHSTEAGSSSWKISFKAMNSLSPFRNWILLNLLFATVGGGLGVFPVEYLRVQAHFAPSLILLLSIGTFIGPMLILQLVGSRVERFGSVRMIRLSVAGFALVLALWFLMSAGLISADWRMVLFLNLSGGMAMSAFNLANGHLWMAVVPSEGKNHYFAIATVITSLFLGIVPILWGWLLDSLGGIDLIAGPLHLRRHSIYFLGICLLSIITLVASRILIEPGCKRGMVEAENLKD